MTTWFYDVSERPSARKTYFRGILIAIPALLIWRILSFAYQPAWGSGWLVLTFSLKYWLIPYGLALGAWCLLHGWSSLDRQCLKPLTSFLAGFMSVFSIFYAVGFWGNSFGAWWLAFPLLSICGTFALPLALRELGTDYMPSGLRWIAAILGSSLFGAAALAFFFLRLEFLAILMTLVYCSALSLLVIVFHKKGGVFQ